MERSQQKHRASRALLPLDLVIWANIEVGLKKQSGCGLGFRV